MTVEYNVLKSNIVKACKAEKESINFIVNYDKLSTSVDDIGLKMVNVGTRSEHLRSTDVALLSEYFKGQKLSWFDEYKEHTTLVFVQADSIDERCQELLDIMNKSKKENPDLDKVSALAEIVAKYPCYFATVISYMSNEPKRFGFPSYEIKCRANTVTIKQQNYKYNHNDI